MNSDQEQNQPQRSFDGARSDLEPRFQILSWKHDNLRDDENEAYTGPWNVDSSRNTAKNVWVMAAECKKRKCEKCIPKSSVCIFVIRIWFDDETESSETPSDDADDDLQYPEGDEECFAPEWFAVEGSLDGSWRSLLLDRGSGSGLVCSIGV